ncbi:hypothetical protein D3C83_297920 [compost metagenome]
MVLSIVRIMFSTVNDASIMIGLPRRYACRSVSVGPGFSITTVTPSAFTDAATICISRFKAALLMR